MATKTSVRPPSGSEIRARRKKRGWTQRALAEAARIDVRVISAYENDKRRPRSKNLHRLVTALGGIGKLDGSSLTSSGAAPTSEATGACAEQVMKSLLHVELARLVGAGEAKIIAFWTDEKGRLSVVTRGPERTLRATMARGAEASVADLQSFRALLDVLIEQALEATR